jgi:hypothetical protein
MIIPVFIPINDNCDKHGKGCECPKCLEKKELDNKPREYYKYRYAVPRGFVIKNILYKTLCLSMIILGFTVGLYPILFVKLDLFTIFLSVFIGISSIISAYILGDKTIKYNFNCKDKIYFEIKYLESWSDKIKQLDVPIGYWLTKQETGWRYKK